jgi:putative membrane protein
MQTTVETPSVEAVNPPSVPVAPARRARDYAALTAKGFCMGSADVVPGVSGGTMAFILGIYEELIFSIRMVGQPEFLGAALRLRIGEIFRLLNWRFLLAVFTGIVLAVVTLAPGLEWLLINEPVLLWSFFFGLVSASVLTVGRRISCWRPIYWAALVVGAALAFWIVGLVPTQTPTTWWFLIFSGAIASCAMILPGISGSFILVLLSKYEYFVSAVNNRDIISLGLAAIGAAVGLVTFAQVLSWLFKRYHDLTVALLTGLMIGSLRKVWPWKEVLQSITDSHGELIPLVERNILPTLTINGAFNVEIAHALGLAALGFVLVLLIERWGNGRPAGESASA